MKSPGTDAIHGTHDIHDSTRARLIEMAHGELPFWPAFRLRRHLARCPACRDEQQEIERLWRSLARLAPAPPARPQLKGKQMQLRVLLAAVTALGTIVAGTAVTRTLVQRTSESSSSVAVSAVRQFWYARGNGRGKLEIRNSSGALVRTLEIAGDEPGQSIWVKVSTLSGTDAAPEIGRVVDSFTINLNQSHAVRDSRGQELSRVTFMPFTLAEDRQHRDEAAAEQTRFVDLYRNPACFTMDTVQATTGGYAELPGLITWSLDLLRDDNGRLIMNKDRHVIPLDNPGLAWKVYGYARVTMTLFTAKGPIVRHYRTEPPVSAPLAVARVPALAGALPATNAEPKVLWFQSAAFPENESCPTGIRSYGTNPRYWLAPNGTWYKTARSGEFSGYGKYTVPDTNGNPLLILDVQPL